MTAASCLDLLLRAALGRAKARLVVASKPDECVLLANAACLNSLQHDPRPLIGLARHSGVA